MPKPALSVDELRAGVSAGSIDTVILAITDMQGRLQGKRFAAEHFAEHGWAAFVGTELEFMLFDETYESASAKRYAGLSPANQYNGDYSILGTSRVEPILRAIRNGMRDAGLNVESAKGECNFGQHE